MIEAALADLASGGDEVIGGIVAGGTEKLPDHGRIELEGVELRAGGDPRRLLYEAVRELRPDAVVDLSDEPVLDPRRRHELAAVALYLGVPYQGADFRFRPPDRPPLCTSPSLAIVSTGKRTGKTAVTGFAARLLAHGGRRPGIVSMGRGGPAEPEVLRGDEAELTARDLVALADGGRHAASDYVEDALLGRVPTVGCRRCGGGLAGAVQFSNVREGVEAMSGLERDFVLLEGSGSAFPPVHADATGLIVPANVPHEYLRGYMGPYRLLLADFVLVTLAENPFGTPSQISALVSLIQGAWHPNGNNKEAADEIQVVRTVFRPQPVRSVEGADAFVATTAPVEAADAIRLHLEREHGCRVVGMTHSLSDRSKLRTELAEAQGGADILLCEIKAAGIDVAARDALDRGMDVVFMDNVPQGVDGDDPAGAILRAAKLAVHRFERGSR